MTLPNKKKNDTEKKHLFNSKLVKMVAVAVCIGCGVLIFNTEKDCEEKEKELTRIQAEIDAYEEENTELQRVLESDDISPYMERVAVEERGYAYPDERRFYDTSRD
ncbi:MAG: hypothetical protein K2J39_08175 [Ruminococcus sp.]|nr:hypothetical protein [Ruminococcus sp.]